MRDGSPHSVAIGTRVTLDSGYVKIKVAQPNGWLYEHRFLMERMLGRFLRDGEVVHHINHNRADNRIENLMVTTASEHARRHHTLPNRWTIRHKACVVCGETTRSHASRGRCTRCYQRTYTPPCRRK
jgi:hypothetical protein